MISHPLSRRQSRRGFTLIELLTVIAIIAILVSIVISITGGVSEQQARAKATGEMQALATALEQYKKANGDYPYYNTTMGEDGMYRVLTCLSGFTRPNGQFFTNANDEEIRTKNLIQFDDFYTGEAQTAVYAIEDVPDALLDPWDNPYQYRYKVDRDDVNWATPRFALWSNGPDGAYSEDLLDGIIPPTYGDDSSNAPEDLDNILFGR